jgi:hypothetical protein
MATRIAGMLTVVLLAASPSLAAEPQEGPLDATLRGSDGKEMARSRWRGKPVILFYEDRHSTTLNSPLKEALFRPREAGGNGDVLPHAGTLVGRDLSQEQRP